MARKNEISAYLLNQMIYEARESVPARFTQ